MGLLERLFKKSPKRNKEEGTSLERYKKSFIHAIEGILYCFKNESKSISVIVTKAKKAAVWTKSPNRRIIYIAKC